MTAQSLLVEIAAALQQGRPTESERLCRLQLGLSANNENLLVLLGLSLQQQMRHDEAVNVYARLAVLFPQSAPHWTNYATALRLAGKLPDAADAASKAIRLAPNDATYYITLGLVQLQQSDHAAAQETLLKACALDPASALAHIHAASALVAVRDAQAYLLLKEWRLWLPLDAPEQLVLARLLTTIGNADDAHDVLKELIQREPMNLAARLQLGALYERNNQLETAGLLLAEVAARSLATDRSLHLEAEHLRATLAMRHGNRDEARAILQAAGPRADLDYSHYFLLADIQDKLGETAAAMQSLAIAHTWQVRELTPIASAHFAPDAPVMPNAVERLSIEDYHAWPPLAGPQTAHSPIFIVGFPRSGTTLLEQMLDAHPLLQSMDERPFFTILGNELAGHRVRMPHGIGRLNQRDCDELRKRYFGLVADKIRRKWDARLVDKNPLNMLWLPLIKRLFPEAKIILALRHPCDVVLSNYMQNYRACVLASACSTLERTAKAYVAAMECWLYHVDLLLPDVLVSRYEELVIDLPRQTQRIATFLELDDAVPMQQFDQHARDKGFIATPSYTQVIQPINRKGIDRWRRYQQEFEQVLPILEPMLKHWGYVT